jgi:hypothetical protein
MTDVDLHAHTVPVVTVVTAIEVHLDETTMKIVEDTIALPQEEAALVTTIRPPRVPVVTTILTAVTIPLLTLTWMATADPTTAHHQEISVLETVVMVVITIVVVTGKHALLLGGNFWD